MLGIALGYALLTFVSPIQDSDIQTLIEELKSEDISKRDAATSKLERLGPQTLELLRAALEKADDPEVRFRLAKAICEIEINHTRPGRMVFTRGKGLEAELYLWENGETQKLTDNKTLEARPLFSPDGKRLVYFSMVSTDGGWKNADVLVMNLASKEITRIGTGIEPTWHSNGKQIAYAKDKEVHVSGADGKGDNVVFRSSGTVRNVTWSSDGKEIAYEQDEGIYVIDIADGKSRKVVGQIDDAPTLYNWSRSADGKMFALVAGSGPYLWDVYTIGAHGSDLAKRTEKPWIGHGIVQWGPDNQHLAICVRLGSGEGPVHPQPGMLDTGLHILDAKSGRIGKVANDVNPILRPRWSPDGKFIVYVTGKQEIWISHVQGGASRKLTEMTSSYDPAGMWFPPDVYWESK